MTFISGQKQFRDVTTRDNNMQGRGINVVAAVLWSRQQECCEDSLMKEETLPGARQQEDKRAHDGPGRGGTWGKPQTPTFGGVREC
mmetsp:Transcript_54272/g.162447  ORF Transcript_54272/g.162447 Transcript_54272/m.162447 type:complete len:86 (+) Transcript_54272:366-623(+)